MKAIYYVIGVSLAAIGIFIYLLLGDTQKSVPKIKLSYFASEKEIAESIQKRLDQEIAQINAFWVGIEPGKAEQLEVALQLKAELEKKQRFVTVIVDQELDLSKEWLEKFKTIEVIALKEHVKELGQLLGDLEKAKQRYFLLTASIYSTATIKQNQIHQIRTAAGISPMTFSFGYFPVTADLENNMAFPCRTEDHAGTADWGCVVANKARFIRRKIEEKNEKPWIGAMDLIGEKDYMVLLYKK
jgi:hypothetical protein